MSKLEIDIYSDIVCPWCFIGSDRLDKVLASLNLNEDVTVTYRTFMLDPFTPPEGERIADRLRRKYGVEPERAFATVEAAAREGGLELDLSKQKWTYRTDAAHTLLRHSRTKGTPTETHRALAKALFVAHFVDAKNISDPEVLVEIAVHHGFDADEAARLVRDPDERSITDEEARSAAKSGIQGVPFFVFDGKIGVSGAQPESVLRAAIEKVRPSDTMTA